MTIIDQWQFAMPPERLVLTITPRLIKLHKIQDDCLMALVFGYSDELLYKMYIHAFPCEKPLIAALAGNINIQCMLDRNSNIIIKN